VARIAPKTDNNDLSFELIKADELAAQIGQEKLRGFISHLQGFIKPEQENQAKKDKDKATKRHGGFNSLLK
jgi:hypothetical protein